MQSSTVFTILERIHVMKSPFVNDKLAETRAYLTEKFRNNIKIYNLEDEDEFNIDQDLPNVVSFPTFSGCPTALETIIEICAGAESYLAANGQNHIIFHCKYGKSKSCLLAATLLLHCGYKTTAFEAIQHVNSKRGCNALHHPSVIRYIYYFEKIVRVDRVPLQSIAISAIRINSIPRFTPSITNAGCKPSISFYQLIKSSSPISFYQKIFGADSNREFIEGLDKYIEFSWTNAPIAVRGNICICVFNGDEKMFQVCFHTAFFEKSYLLFEKPFVDIACEDTDHRLFSKEFSVEIIGNRIPDDFNRTNVENDPEDFLHNSEPRYELDE